MPFALCPRMLFLLCKIALLATFFSLLVLPYAPAHLSRVFYIFQAYIYPTYTQGIIPPPDHFSGAWITYYFSGGLHTSVDYQNGVENGWAIEYYENGFRKARTPYRNGFTYGTCNRWYATGNPEKQWTVLDGILYPPILEWTEGGFLQADYPAGRFQKNGGPMRYCDDERINYGYGAIRP